MCEDDYRFSYVLMSVSDIAHRYVVSVIQLCDSTGLTLPVLSSLAAVSSLACKFGDAF